MQIPKKAAGPLCPRVRSPSPSSSSFHQGKLGAINRTEIQNFLSTGLVPNLLLTFIKFLVGEMAFLNSLKFTPP